MQLTILRPTQTCHLRHFLVHLKALSLEFRWGMRRQFQRQFPRKQALLLGLGLKRFMQALGAVLLDCFTFGLGRQWVQRIQFRGQGRVFAQESVQGELVVFAGL